MKKSFISVAIAGALAVGFTGCGKSEPKPLLKTSTTIQESHNITTKYNDTISNQPVTLKEFKEAVIYNSKFKGVFANDQMTVKRSKGTSLKEYKGRDIRFRGDNIEVIYASGVADKKIKYPFDGKQEFMTFTKYEIPFTVTGDNGNFTYKTSFPKEAISIDNSISFTKAHMPFAPAKDLELDTHRIFKALGEIPVYRDYVVKGEVNSKYDPQSIKANFKRLLEYGKLIYNKKGYSVNYEVMPYRGGSKVEYSIKLDYALSPSGGATLQAADAENIKKAVEKIVND